MVRFAPVEAALLTLAVGLCAMALVLGIAAPASAFEPAREQLTMSSEFVTAAPPGHAPRVKIDDVDTYMTDSEGSSQALLPTVLWAASCARSDRLRLPSFAVLLDRSVRPPLRPPIA